MTGTSASWCTVVHLCFVFQFSSESFPLCCGGGRLNWEWPAVNHAKCWQWEWLSSSTQQPPTHPHPSQPWLKDLHHIVGNSDLQPVRCWWNQFPFCMATTGRQTANFRQVSVNVGFSDFLPCAVNWPLNTSPPTCLSVAWQADSGELIQISHVTTSGVWPWHASFGFVKFREVQRGGCTFIDVDSSWQLKLSCC